MPCPGPPQPTLSGSDEPGISALYNSLGVFSRCDPSSPYIHPVGWCQEHGKPLTPPQGESVAWECGLHWHILLGTGFPGWHGEPGGANPMALACLQAQAVSFSKATAREVACFCRGSCTRVQVQHGGCVRPSGDMRRSKLSVQAQMFLLPCTLDFMVHEKIVVLLDVSQVPVCLAQTWLVLQGSRTFWGICRLPAGVSHLLHLPPSRLS